MAKKKKQKKQKIRIYFLDGKCDTIPQRLWDDYEINNGLFVVNKGGAAVASRKGVTPQMNTKGMTNEIH